MKTGLKAKFAKALDFPREMMLDVPKLTLYGGSELIIENFNGIIEYSKESARINTAAGVYTIKGFELELLEITSYEILVKGKIFGIALN